MGAVSSPGPEAGSGGADRGSDERLRALLEHSFDVSALVGRDGSIEYVSPALERVLGDTPGELVGRAWFEVVHPDDVGEARRRFAEVQERPGASLSLGVTLRHRDGSWRWVEARLMNRLDEPAIGAVAAHFRDQTERRRVEESLRGQERLMNALTGNSSLALFILDKGQRCTFMNPAAERLTGYTFDEVRDRVLHDVVHHTRPDGTPFPLAECPIERAFPENFREQGEEVFVHKDGHFYPVSYTASPIRDGDVVVGTVLEVSDITEQQRAHEIRERLAAIVESSDDVIVSKDLNGIITSWNRGAERILGYTAAEVIGRHVSMLMPPDHIEDTHKILGMIRRGEKVDHYETRRRRKDGTIIDVSLTVSPIRDASGRIIGASKIGRDITREKQVEAERSEAERRKDEFLAMLAHELRNPLSSINNAVQLFGRLETEEDLEWAKEVVQRQVKHLARLIDDLLDVSRISRGKISLRREPLDLAPVVSSAVEVVRPLLEERKHELSVSLANGGLRVEADPLRLEQVLVNLLTNAAKYTDSSGHIEVLARREGPEVVVRVRDNGMGITPELLPRVFDLFTQGDRTMARSEGGLGIGLTLVQKLAEMHGGRVAAASEGPGRGSEFTVRLPALASTASPREAAPFGGLPRFARQSSRVLVVDDNVDNANGLSRLLKLLGHRVEVAHDGPAAIEAARALRPEVILLDIGLPGMDGYQVARRLRNEECCKGALIIAVSGYGQPEDRRKSEEAGFDQHLVKPVDHEALMALFVPRAG